MRSIEERNIIVEQHIQLATRLAERRYKSVHRSVVFGDLLSAAYSGLIDAATKFNQDLVNPQAKRPFEAYAAQRIAGEMNDYLRSCNWGTRGNPQRLMSLEREAYPNVGGNVHNWGEGGHSPKVSDTCMSNERTVVDHLNGEELFDKVIRCLPHRDKWVFRLRFLAGLTMKEVADVVEISESRVSQILSQDTEYLRFIWTGKIDELWGEIIPEE